jgi:pectinesterase
VQAVALMTTGDKLVFDNVRVLGNQDTLFLSTAGYSTIARSYFKSSYVQGDVDFIFGRGTAVFESCTIKYLSTRWGNNGNHIAPATAAGNAYGFLFSGSHFTKDSSTGSNVTSLGRSWDEGVSTGAYIAGSSPNGQAVIRESTLDSHIKLQAPWGTSTSGRAFSASGNRLREYKNTGGGS